MSTRALRRCTDDWRVLTSPGGAGDGVVAPRGRRVVFLRPPSSEFGLASPSHLDDLEGLAELERLPFGELLGAVPHAGLELGPVADLLHVGAQRMDLAIEGLGNVDDLVRVLRTKKPDLGGLVHFETFLKMLREIERVARGRVDRIRRR